MNKKITVIAIDGHGADIIQQAVKVLEAIAAEFKHKFTIKRLPISIEAVKKHGESQPLSTIEAALKSDAILAGNHSQGQEILIQLKERFNYFVHYRPVNSIKALTHLSPIKPKLLEKVDLVLIREPDEKKANTLTEKDKTFAFEKRARFAFNQALLRRKQLSFVVKEDDLQENEKRLLLNMAKQYSSVKIDLMNIETILPALVQNPALFDIILSNRQSGRVLESQSILLNSVGGIVAEGLIDDESLYYEPLPFSNPPNAGKDTANPIGSILSVALMLDQFGLSAEANLVREAAIWTINNGFFTRDIDSTNFYYTSTIGDLVSEFILGKIPDSVNHSNIEIRKSTII